MKMLITERQLLSILKKKKQIKKDVEEASDITSTSSTPAASTTSSTAAPITDPSGSSTSTDELGTSPSAADYPPYPEVGHWESGVTRGPANQIATNSKWSDVVGSKLTRGKANPLK